MQDIGVKINKRKRFLSNLELTKLLQALNNNFFSPYYENLIHLLVVFGSRTVEVRLSNIDEWDLKSRLWTVPEQHSKTGEKIIRPILDRVYLLIERLIEQNKKSGLFARRIKREYGGEFHWWQGLPTAGAF